MRTPRELFHDAINSMNSGNGPEAERLFKKVLQSHPRHYGALNLLTIVLMSMKRYREAEKFIKTAIAVDRGRDASFHNYGIILTQLGRPREALAQLSHALNLGSDWLRDGCHRGNGIR